MRNQSIKFTGIRSEYKILSFCIFTLFPFWAYAQSTTSAQKVLEFYQKYMITCDHVFNNGTEKKRDGLFCNMDIGKYITKELHKKIISAYKSGTYSDLTGDRNYFTHTQDFDARWASFMSVTEIKADRNNSVIRLLINFPKGAGEPLAVCVRLHRESSVWKIYQVDPSLYTDLPDCKDK
jgi:glucose-6-phosphate 1-dehydrogenase